MDDNGYQGNGEMHSMNDDLYQRLLEIASGMSTQRTGLRFLNQYFTEPMAVGGWLPCSAGVYAILVSDPSWRPRPYRPIYFGEAEDLAGRLTASQERLEEWRRTAGDAGTLYVTYHLTSGSEADRTALKGGLIREYRPETNTPAGDSPGNAERAPEAQAAAG
jgi:hypothetical protein